MKIIDISLPLSSNTLLWSGSPEFKLNHYKQLKAGDDCNNSYLTCDVHTGTHIDAPSHFLLNGTTIEQLSLDVLMGPATVCHLPGIPAIRAADLESLALPPGIRRLLLRTDNSELWNAQVNEFRQDYVGLTSEAAQWIAASGIQLVGTDYLSVAGFDDTVKTHRILLEMGIVLLEGINLYGVEAREYELICLPLKLMGAEGTPARAVLREMVSQQ